MSTSGDFKVPSFIEFTSNVDKAVQNILDQLAKIPKQINTGINVGGPKGTGASSGAKLPTYLQAQKAQILLLQAKQKEQIAADKAAAAASNTAARQKLQTTAQQARVNATVNAANVRSLTAQMKLQQAIAAHQAASQAQALRNARALQATTSSKVSGSTNGGPVSYSKSISELKRLRYTINDVDSELGKLGFQTILTAKRFAAFIGVSGIFIGITTAIKDGLSSAIAYEKQMAKISQVTGTSIRDLGDLDKEITHLSTTLGVGSDSISEIALTLAQAGLSASETTKALDILSKTELSATFGDIKNTTEGAIAIMAQFKTGAADLAGQLSTVNTISAKFAVESQDLVEVIRKSGGAFRATGGELNELLALFTSVRATTRESAESISTGLRTIFTRLQRNRTVSFLDDMGIELRDVKGEFIGIYPAIEKLSTALKDISGTDPRFNQIVEELGGFRQVSKVIPLLKEFETSQKALSVARRAGNSVDRDARIAQGTLANQMVRVREEFLALTRSYYNDGGLKTIISRTLDLASAFIKVADAVRPLVPLIASIGAASFIKSIPSFVGGIQKQHVSPLIKRSAGGPVPGSGSGDTVPALLEPGEFVVKKSAVKALGMSKMHNINRYAGGGSVRRGGRIFKANSSNSDFFVPNLSKSAKNSVSTYISESFDNINGVLRHGDDFPLNRFNPPNKMNLKQVKKHIRNISSSINSSKIKNNVVLYRGVSGNGIDNIQSQLGHNLGSREVVGKSFTDKGFSSFSADKDIAHDFAHRLTPYDNGHVFKLLARKGTKGLSFNSSEREVLFQKGSKYRILSTSPKETVIRKYSIGGKVKQWWQGSHSTKSQLKDLFSKGGLRRSLGISEANPFMGDAGYTSGSNVYPFVNKRAPNINIMTRGEFEAQQRGLGIFGNPINNSGISLAKPMSGQTSLYPRFQVPGKSLPSGATFPHPGLNSLPGTQSSSITLPPQIVKKTGFIPHRRYQNYVGSKQSIAEKLKLKKYLLEFQKKTGINPAGLVNSVDVLRKNAIKSKINTYRGVYRPTDRSISVVPENINSKQSYGSSPSVKSTLYHELGHAVDNKVGTMQFNSYINSKSGQSKLAEIYKSLNIKDRQLLLDKKKMSKKHFDYRGQSQEEFANFFSEYLRGTIKLPTAQKRTANRLIKKIFSNSAIESQARAEASGRTINDVVGLRNKIRKKYAGGGHVNGQGDTDNVPALLTPGEFVINKRSAQAFGYHNLKKVNKYATGGMVGPAAVGAAVVGPQILGSMLNNNPSKEFSAFTNAITTASGAILLFVLGIRKDVTAYDDAMSTAVDELNSARTDLKNNKKEYDENKVAARNNFKESQQGLLITASKKNGAGLPTKEAFEARDKIMSDAQEFKIASNERKKEYTKLRESNLLREKENAQILATSQNSKLRDEKFNRYTENITAISAGLILFGSTIQTLNDDLASRGKREGYFGLGTSTEAGIGSALSSGGQGAVTGALVGGSVAGPAGALVGAIGLGLGSAVYGYITGQSRAESTIKNFDTKQSLEKFNKTLENIQKGRSTVSSSRFAVNSGLKDINKKFFELKGEDFDSFTGAVGGSIDTLEMVFNENLKAAKSVEQFTNENNELINVLARFGGQSIPELEKKIKDEIEARKKSIKAADAFADIQKQNARRLEATFAITTALTAAETSIHSFSDILEKSAELMNGSFGSQKSNFNFSALSNISEARPQDLKRQANQAAGFIGGPAQGVANDIVQAGQLSSTLPSVLNEAVFRNQLEGDDLIDHLKTKLGDGFASGLIIEAVKKEIGATGDTTKFGEKFRQDPIGLTKSIQASLQPLAQALADAAPRITKEFDSYADGLAAARESFLSSLEGLSKAIDIAQSGREFNQNAIGKPLEFGEESAFDLQRQNIITRGRGVGDLGTSLKNSQDNILSLSVDRQNAKTPQEFKELTKVIESNILETQMVTKGLEYLADVNSRLSVVEKERSRLASIREAKTNLAKGFAFGDPAAKLEIVKGLFAVKQIEQNIEAGLKPFEGINNELKQAALNIYEQNSDSNVFNGKTGKEKISQISGLDLGVNLGVAPDEQVLINQGNVIIDQARAAQEILNQNVKDNNALFINGLDTKFDTFFTKLAQFFKEDVEEKKKNVNNEIDAQIGGIEKQIQQINTAKQKVGVDKNTPLSVVSNNIDTAIKIKKNREDLAAAEKEFKTIKRHANPNPFEDNSDINFNQVVNTSKLRRIITGEEGLKLEKQIADIKASKDYIGNKNVKIADVTAKSFAKFKEDKQKENSLLEEGFGVEQQIKEGFIKGAEEAKKILEKVGTTEEVQQLRKKQVELKATKRATGGSVFGARGTDTVPAMTTDGRPYMLTPGEFVMKRSAVSKYGVGTLKKMNTGYLAGGGYLSPVTKEEQELKDQLANDSVDSMLKQKNDVRLKQAVIDRKQSIRNQKNDKFLSEELFGRKEDNLKIIEENKKRIERADKISSSLPEKNDDVYKPSPANKLPPSKAKGIGGFRERKRIERQLIEDEENAKKALNERRIKSDDYISKGYVNEREQKEKQSSDFRKTRPFNPKLEKGLEKRRLAELGVPSVNGDFSPLGFKPQPYSAYGASPYDSNKFKPVKSSKPPVVQNPVYPTGVSNLGKNAPKVVPPPLSPAMQMAQQAGIAATSSQYKPGYVFPATVPTATPGGPTANPTNQPQNPTPATTQPGSTINPKLMEDFIRVVDKLAGTKLELQINGTLNVNINSPNIADNIVEKFKPVLVDYVESEVNKAVNKLIGDANLGIAPRTPTKKVVKE